MSTYGELGPGQTGRKTEEEGESLDDRRPGHPQTLTLHVSPQTENNVTEDVVVQKVVGVLTPVHGPTTGTAHTGFPLLLVLPVLRHGPSYRLAVIPMVG